MFGDPNCTPYWKLLNSIPRSVLEPIIHPAVVSNLAPSTSTGHSARSSFFGSKLGNWINFLFALVLGCSDERVYTFFPKKKIKINIPLIKNFILLKIFPPPLLTRMF